MASEILIGIFKLFLHFFFQNGILTVVATSRFGSLTLDFKTNADVSDKNKYNNFRNKVFVYFTQETSSRNFKAGSKGPKVIPYLKVQVSLFTLPTARTTLK